MLRHIGLKRTFAHNLRIASFLSFVAGGINVIGFIMIGTFTTNVTGHFALFSNEIVEINISKALIYFTYVFSFFFGSFISAIIVESILRKGPSNRLILPLITQSAIFFLLTLYLHYYQNVSVDLVACVLLFSMGLQNSLVTIISKSIVRTTHLTGLFTDLGIELGQMLFRKTNYKKTKLLSSVKLRLNIILFFFLGGVFFGIIYSFVNYQSLTVCGIILLSVILYDIINLKLKRLKKI